LFNTAVEAAVDVATQEYHPRAKAAKDVTAAAVLTTSLLSLIVAGYLFGPALLQLPSVLMREWQSRPGAVGLHAVVFAFLLLSSAGIQRN
jgi:hypothetical protein